MLIYTRKPERSPVVEEISEMRIVEHVNGEVEYWGD